MSTLLKQSCASFLFASLSNYRDLIAASLYVRLLQPHLMHRSPPCSLKATQHATGLMVEVALLLPSRGLPSSHRQLRWTHTWGLAILGQDIVIFIISNMAAVVRAGQASVGFWLLSCYRLCLLHPGTRCAV